MNYETSSPVTMSDAELLQNIARDAKMVGGLYSYDSLVEELRNRRPHA